MIRVQELDDFAATIERRFGHLPDGSRQTELVRTLEQRMRAVAAPDYAAYRALLERSAEEWSALAPLLTVPETYFFRLPDQFEALAGAVIPALLRRRAPESGLRFLSAGCASGEEPYSMRILLNERFTQLAASQPTHGGCPVAIDGFDLSASALERARVGEYSEWSLRATSEQRRRDHFQRLGKPEDKRLAALYRLLPAARAGVSFRQVNLLDAPGAEEPRYDVIFCRNVLIYFTDRAVKQAIARLTERLLPGGYLFLGPAESLRGLSRDFILAQTHDVFYYRLREGAGGEVPRAETAFPVAKRAAAVTQAPAELPPQTWFESIGTLGSRLNALMPAEGMKVSAGAGAATAVAPAPVQPARKAAASRRVQESAVIPADASGVRRASTTASRTGANAPTPEPAPDFLALVAAERFGEALALLEALPADADAGLPADRRLLRAAMLVHLSRYEEAGRECTLLLEQGRPDAGAHYLAGLCRDHAGKTAEAEQQMTEATYLDPGFALPLLHRGLMAGRRGDTAAARTALTRALKALDRQRDHEADARLTLFAGAVSRAGLRQLCRTELARLDRA